MYAHNRFSQGNRRASHPIGLLFASRKKKHFPLLENFSRPRLDFDPTNDVQKEMIGDAEQVMSSCLLNAFRARDRHLCLKCIFGGGAFGGSVRSGSNLKTANVCLQTLFARLLTAQLSASISLKHLFEFGRAPHSICREHDSLVLLPLSNLPMCSERGDS